MKICTLLKNLTNLILFNSRETFEFQSKYFPNNHEKMRLFQNPAPNKYFVSYEKYIREISSENKKLRNIAIISNHVPKELIEISEGLLESGIITNYIGVDQQLNRLVTPELLLNYDIIITIGKTVQYCIAIAKSVYVYDYMGGAGFLAENNFATNEFHNFSGRPFGKKTTQEIFNDLLSGYYTNIEYMERLRASFGPTVNLNNNMENILNLEYEAVEFQIDDEFRLPLLALQGYSRNLHNSITWVEGIYKAMYSEPMRKEGTQNRSRSLGRLHVSPQALIKRIYRKIKKILYRLTES